MVFLWCLLRLSYGFLWFSYGVPVVFLWFSYGLLEWGGRFASPRDENFLREGGGRLRFLSSVCPSLHDRKGREATAAGWRRPKHMGNATFGSPREVIFGQLVKWLFLATCLTFLQTRSRF